MADRVVKVSDLSEQIIEEDDELAHLVVEAHPDFPDAITLDVRPQEVEGEIPENGDLVVLSYIGPGESSGHRFFMEQEDFAKLATASSMTDVLENARRAQQQPAPRRGRPRRASTGQTTEKTDYATPEHAGQPHRGRATEAEQEYVRTHLPEVNDRLRKAGKRVIDPADPKMAERYGLSPQQTTETATAAS